MPETFLKTPLLLTPQFFARPWGGRRLATELGKEVPERGGPWGEAWELSDHPAGRSVVAAGPYAGRLFGDLVRRFPEPMCGAGRAPERFPLLIKIIDAAEDLSIQVHPNDAGAPAGERGKAECWFIMDCEPGALIVYGLAPGMTAERLRRAAEAGEMEPCLRRIPIRRGDFVAVPAGIVHAILAGTLLCEIQQCSDTTYRLWDWNRQPPRPLHVGESCRVAECDPAKIPAVVNVHDLAGGAWHDLVRNEFFEVRTAAWPAGARAEVDVKNPHGVALNVVEGDGRIEAEGLEAGGASLKLGQTWFLPAGLERWTVRAGPGGLRLLASASLEL